MPSDYNPQLNQVPYGSMAVQGMPSSGYLHQQYMDPNYQINVSPSKLANAMGSLSLQQGQVPIANQLPNMIGPGMIPNNDLNIPHFQQIPYQNQSIKNKSVIFYLIL